MLSFHLTFAQEGKESKKKMRKGKGTQSPTTINKTDKSAKIIMEDVEYKEEPNVIKEDVQELEEESPLRGEPIIGAEIFEEQQPGEPEKKKEPVKKKQVNKSNGKKEN
jgi:hypothetical protein